MLKLVFDTFSYYNVYLHYIVMRQKKLKTNFESA